MNKKIFIFLTVLTIIFALLLVAGCDRRSNENADGNSDNNNFSSGNLSSGEDGITSGDEQNKPHSHTYADVWTTDKDHHWRAATCGHDSIIDKETHSFNTDNICSACGYCFSDGFLFQLNSDNASYSVTGLEEDNSKTQINIPSTYNGKPVTGIAKNAFKDRKDITSVTLPSGISYIESFAFDGCEGLQGVYITELASWLNIKFQGDCSNPLQYAHKLYVNNQLVTQLNISKDITNFNIFSIYNYVDLNAITVEAENTKYKSDGNCLIEKETGRLIFGCKNSVIPSYVTSIGSASFEGCQGLTSVVIPSSVEHIGFDAFRDCKDLTNVRIEAGLNYIYDGAFQNCNNLKEINLPIGIKTIGMKAFYGCESLTEIQIPSGAQKIDQGAFASCISLTKLTLPTGIEEIGSLAFANCRALTIYCEEESKPNYWTEAWNNSCPVVWDCKNNEIAQDGNIYFVDENGLRYALKDGKAALTLQSQSLSGNKTIPASIVYKGTDYEVTKINANAFMSCHTLTGVVIPVSVINVDMSAFKYCDNLTIYCQAATKPDGWNSWWNDGNRPVVWEYNEINL